MYKIYINNYTDICGGGTPRGGGDFGTRDIEPPPIPCPYRDTAVTVYVRGKDGKVLAECGQQWAVPRAKYVYAGGQRIAMYNSSGYLFFYLNDHLGSARVVIDTTGTVKDKYYTSSFGAPTGQTVNLNQRYRYTGKPFDEDGGIDIYYYGARYYDPMLGRFLAIDPMADGYPSWNPYQYTMANPIKFVDPNGLWVSDANAQKFVDIAIKYKGTPRSTMDCSRLVEVTLANMNSAGVETWMYDKYSAFHSPRRKGRFNTGAETTNMLERAKAGHYDMQILNFDIGTMKKGDLIIMEGHVEIVTAVDVESKTFNTVGASWKEKEIVEREGKTIDWWKNAFLGKESHILRISEKQKKARRLYKNFEDMWNDIYAPENN